MAQVYDNFADTYLGSMADGATASSGSANGTWAINSSSITVASTSGTIEVGQEVTGTGIPADANVISIDGSTVVISENMAAAGSGVSLTFTGHGVYGAFNGTKDGPGTDNDGDALTTGMLYFNTTDNEMRIYDGGNWIAASAAGSASFVEYKYVASGGQTTFTGSDANGATLSYTVSNVHVFLNGVRLDASDMTATNGTSIVLGSGAVANDELVIIAWKSFTVSDAVSASAGGTFNGNIIIAGDLRVNGGEFLDANGLELFKITSTGSAVNEFTLANAATGNAPTISVTGDDTNIDLTLSPKGSGEVNISKVDIDAGTIDGTTIATSNITVGSSKTLNVSAGTLTTSTAQKQAIVQAGPGSGTLDVSSGTFTTSAAQKQAIIDGGRTMPAGMIAPFGMSSAPTGWLVCNGSAVSRSTYSDLFGVISTTWGSGDGSSTFNLPDLRGAFLRGTGTAGVSSDYAGPNVGAYQDDANAEHNHTGSSANAGGHSHSGNTGSDGVHNHSGSTNTTGSHTHSYYTSSTWQTNGGRVWYSDSRGGASYTTGGSGNHSHSLSINNSSSHTHSISAESDHSHTITVANSGGTEARPYNRGVQYCIKT